VTALAQKVPDSHQPLAWFREFLKEELTPYPGRAALACRMVIAATLVMIITMTFRMPYGAYGAIYALTISRESPQTTVKTVKTIVIAFLIGAAYILVGALFFLDDPMLRFLWVIGAFFTMFYAISVLANYGAATRFGYLIVITVPLWDRHIPAELKVEGTLWAVWAITIASVVTVLVEWVFAEIRPADDLVRSIAERLASAEEFLRCYSAGRTPVDQSTGKQVTRLAMVGTSRLRRILRRSTYSRRYSEQMSAVVALVGRLVDIAANLSQLSIQASGKDLQRIRGLATSVARIRDDLLTGRVPGPVELVGEGSGGVPLLREMEKTVSLIPEVFAGGSGTISEYAHSPSGGERPPTLFVPDALSNPEHVKLALKGSLAANICYIVYTATAWPGISTAVSTCLLTALSTIGSSRQKQALRFAGALMGGFFVGMGSQIFILPYLDSITGFTLLFGAVTGVAAWFATSSARLSYFGVQLAVAFYLINLQEFKVQTSLGIARDRVVGILLGLFMMWLVYDQLWGAPAAVEMSRTFTSNLRSMAQLVREPLPGEKSLAIERCSSLRETINTNFDKVRSLADGVLFEFSSSRQKDLALRDRIRQWQPQLHTLFVTQIVLLKYRLQLPGFELPKAVLVAQQGFDYRLAMILDGMANRMEGKASEEQHNIEDAFGCLEQTVRTCCSMGPQRLLTVELQTLLALSRNTAGLTTFLGKEM
jgi:multidrug resistance protein MdtO